MTSYYKEDSTGKPLKVGQTVKIVKAYQSSMSLKKIDWKIVEVLSYKVLLMPLVSRPDGKGFEEMWFDNERVAVVKQPAPPVAEKPKTPELKVGEVVEIFGAEYGKPLVKDGSSSLDAYLGLKCEISAVGFGSGGDALLKPLTERPYGHGFVEFYWPKAGVKLSSKDEPAADIAYSSKFKVGDVVEIFANGKTGKPLVKGGSDYLDKFIGLKAKVVKEAKDDSGNPQTGCLIEPLTDRPDGMKKAEFNWGPKGLKAAVFVEQKFQVGDKVLGSYGNGGTKKLGKVTSYNPDLPYPYTVMLDENWEDIFKEVMLELAPTEDSWTPLTEMPKKGDKVKLHYKPSSAYSTWTGDDICLVEGNIGSTVIMRRIDGTKGDDGKGKLGFEKQYLEMIEPAKNELKVGDKVKILGAPSTKYKIGSVGIITNILTPPWGFKSYEVKFGDQAYATHTHTQDQLELTDEPITGTSTELKVGDHVKILDKPSFKYGVGSIGYIESINKASKYSKYCVKFLNDPDATHFHSEGQIELTTEPLTDKSVSTKSSKTKLKPTDSPKVGDVVELGKSTHSWLDDFIGLPVRIDKIGTGTSSGKVWIKPLRDRPDRKGNTWTAEEKRAHFWWTTAQLNEFSGIFKKGDRVKVLPGNGSQTGQVGTIHHVHDDKSLTIMIEGQTKGFSGYFTPEGSTSKPKPDVVLTDEPLTGVSETLYLDIETSISNSITGISTVATKNLSPTDVKKLKVLAAISELMKDKTLPAVIRFEKIADQLEKVGML